MRRLKLWWKRWNLSRQARAWQHANDERLVAEAAFALNRYARAHARWDHERNLFYKLKNHLIHVFQEQGFVQRVTMSVQNFPCWRCEGSGEEPYDNWDYDDPEPCHKCDGTGIYRQAFLYGFYFNIHGRRYMWHQPKTLVTWDTGPFEMGGVYHEPDRNGHEGSGLSQETIYLYLGVLYHYLRAHSIPDSEIAYTPGLWWSLWTDIEYWWINTRLERYLWRQRRRFRSWKHNAAKLGHFISTGELPEPEVEDLPF